MDFSFTSDQEDLQGLARQILTDATTIRDHQPASRYVPGPDSGRDADSAKPPNTPGGGALV